MEKNPTYERIQIRLYEGLDILRIQKRISPNSVVYRDLMAIADTPEHSDIPGMEDIPGIFSPIHKGEPIMHIWVNDKNIVIQPNFYHGRGKYLKLIQNQHRYTFILDQLGIKYRIFKPRNPRRKSTVHHRILIPIKPRY